MSVIVNGQSREHKVGSARDEFNKVRRCGAPFLC